MRPQSSTRFLTTVFLLPLVLGASRNKGAGILAAKVVSNTAASLKIAWGYGWIPNLEASFTGMDDATLEAFAAINENVTSLAVVAKPPNRPLHHGLNSRLQAFDSAHLRLRTPPFLSFYWGGRVLQLQKVISTEPKTRSTIFRPESPCIVQERCCSPPAPSRKSQRHIRVLNVTRRGKPPGQNSQCMEATIKRYWKSLHSARGTIFVVLFRKASNKGAETLSKHRPFPG